MNEMLDELRGLYSKQKNKPTIRFYEGFEQIKEIFRQTLTAKEIFGIASTKQLFSYSETFFDWYRKEIFKRKIIFHDIVTNASKTESETKVKSQLKGYLSLKSLPEHYEDVPIDILIWNDNVSLISLEPPVFGTVLTNSAMAKAFRILFDLAWKQLD